MDYLMDTFTRAPSQVLVKSSQTFGEEAARMMTTAVEESLRTATEQIQSSVQETGETMVHTVERSTERLADTVQETGIQAFEEWGMSIERAFTEVGRHMESGILKGTRHGCRLMDATLRASFNSMGDALERSAIVASQNMRTFGSEQIPLFRRTFQRELNVLCIAVCTLSVAALIASLAFALHTGLLAAITSLLFHRSLMLTLFCAAIAHTLHLWTASPSATMFDYPKTVFGMVAAVAFVAGNIARDAVMFSTANTAVLLLVTGTTTGLLYGTGLRRMVDGAREMMNTWREFREFRRQRKRRRRQREDDNNNNNNNNNGDDDNNDDDERWNGDKSSDDSSDSSSDNDNTNNNDTNNNDTNKHHSAASLSLSSKSKTNTNPKMNTNTDTTSKHQHQHHHTSQSKHQNKSGDPSPNNGEVQHHPLSQASVEKPRTPRTDFEPNALHSSLSAAKTLPATRHQYRKKFKQNDE